MGRGLYILHPLSSEGYFYGLDLGTPEGSCSPVLGVDVSVGLLAGIPTLWPFMCVVSQVALPYKLGFKKYYPKKAR